MARAADPIRLRDLAPIDLARRLRGALLCTAYDAVRWRSGAFNRPKRSDESLLADAVEALKQTGRIEYVGEYGDELTTFVPLVYWLKTEGLLEHRQVVTYQGMRPYYYFLDPEQISEKTGRREWIVECDRPYPTNNGFLFTPRSWHKFPDYRRRYQNSGRKFEKPILFIQNKFAVEWARGPINYLPLGNLKSMFDIFGERFNIIYSRPRSLPERLGYTEDHNSHCDYPDLPIARSRRGVTILEDYCEAQDLDYNLTKLQILADCHLYISVHGGGANAIACFGDALMILFERTSLEYPFSYMRGHYKHYADPPPVLLLARSYDDLDRAVEVMAAVDVDSNEVRVPRASLKALNSLRV